MNSILTKVKYIKGKSPYQAIHRENFGACSTLEVKYKEQLVMNIPLKCAVDPWFTSGLFCFFREPVAVGKKYKGKAYRLSILSSLGALGERREVPYEKFISPFIWRLFSTDVCVQNPKEFVPLANAFYPFYKEFTSEVYDIVDKFYGNFDVEGEEVAHWKNSIVSSLKLKYTVQLGDYIQEEALLSMQEKVKNHLSVYSCLELGHLKYRGEQRYPVNFNRLLGTMIAFDTKPYVITKEFDSITYEEYKSFLLFFFGKDQLNYSNFGETYLEDYKTMEDLFLVFWSLSMSLFLIVKYPKATEAPEIDIEASKKYHELIERNAFWKRFLKIKV